MILASICYSKPPRQCYRYRIDQQRTISETFNPEMVSQRFGPGDLQWLVQAVPMTALVCAATIALLLLLVRIVAQSLGSQHRRTRETPPNFLLGSSKSSLPLPNQRLSLSPPHSHTAPVPHPWTCKSLGLRWQLTHRLQRGTSSPQHVHQLQEFSNWTTYGKFDEDSELRGGVESGTLWGRSSVSPALRQLDPPLQPRC